MKGFLRNGGVNRQVPYSQLVYAGSGKLCVGCVQKMKDVPGWFTAKGYQVAAINVASSLSFRAQGRWMRPKVHSRGRSVGVRMSIRPAMQRSNSHLSGLKRGPMGSC